MDEFGEMSQDSDKMDVTVGDKSLNSELVNEEEEDNEDDLVKYTDTKVRRESENSVIYTEENIGSLNSKPNKWKLVEDMDVSEDELNAGFVPSFKIEIEENLPQEETNLEEVYIKEEAAECLEHFNDVSARQKIEDEEHEIRFDFVDATSCEGPGEGQNSNKSVLFVSEDGKTEAEGQNSNESVRFVSEDGKNEAEGENSNESVRFVSENGKTEGEGQNSNESVRFVSEDGKTEAEGQNSNESVRFVSENGKTEGEGQNSNESVRFVSEYGKKKVSVNSGVEESFTCILCNKLFKSEKALKVHVYNHVKGRRYKCGSCDKSFGTYSKLKSHKVVHNSKSRKVVHNSKSHKVVHNSKSHKVVHNSKSHKVVHNSKSHKVVKDVRKKASLFLCHLCERPFKSISSIRYHLGKHLEERPYKCSNCSKTFRYLILLRQHMDGWIHNENITKPFSLHCFSSNVAPEYHICPVCNRVFMLEIYLRKHMNTHVDELTYICRTCNKTFMQFSSLKKHSLIHSNKQCICSVCNKKFTNHFVFKRHMSLHKQ